MRSFVKGEQVEFQDYRRCWVRGTVQAWEPDEDKVHVLFQDTAARAPRVVVLNPKRVRPV